MRVNKFSVSTGLAASLAVTATAIAGGWEPVSAAQLSGTIDLKTGSYTGALWNKNGHASFVQTPTNQYVDNYYETVIKLNLDPANKPLFTSAIFEIHYDGDPWGMSVNIGDSASNNGNKGDWSEQRNDAEMQIGYLNGSSQFSNDMFVFGSDYHSGWLLSKEADLVSQGTTLSLTVSNNQLQWDNDSGNAGELNSPYLYALDGQSDSEGPVNYDIFAAFNRSIDGIYRPGAGVDKVKITLVGNPATPVPEPSSLFGLLALGSFGVSSLLKSKEKKGEAS